jgi:hypothetical protein
MWIDVRAALRGHACGVPTSSEAASWMFWMSWMSWTAARIGAG